MLRITVSGDYRTNGGKEGNIVDFENVVGIMPDCNLDENGILSHVKARYLAQWVKDDKRYTARFASARTTYIDKVEKVAGTPSCIGKDIKSLSWEELQDLAVLKNLLRIPLEHSVDLREARETAYLEYSKLILMEEINTKAPGYSFIKLPALKVEHEGMAVLEDKQSNEDAIAAEQENGDINSVPGGDQTFTIEELRKVADAKGIKYYPATGKKKLYAMIFGEQAAQ